MNIPPQYLAIIVQLLCTTQYISCRVHNYTNPTVQITIATMPYSYFVLGQYDFKTNTTIYGGLCFDIINYITSKHNLTYDVKRHEHYSWGVQLSTGKWNGLIGEVISGEADMAANDFTISYERTKVVDFSSQFADDAVVLTMHHENKQPFGVFHPLESFVWICCLVTIVIVGLVVFVLVWNNKMSEVQSNATLADCILLAARIQLLQGTVHYCSKTSMASFLWNNYLYSKLYAMSWFRNLK